MKMPLGEGVFVRWDSAKQNRIRIGDKVRITTPKQTVNRIDSELGDYTDNIDNYVIVGTLILRLSKGLMLRVGEEGHYFYYKISYSPYCSTVKRIWELL